MKIIIEISAEDFENVKCGRGAVSMMRKAIIHGTPLPKVRGRLLILSENRLKENQINLDWSCQKWISEVGSSNATVAIIKADKAESEDEG